MAEKIVTVSDLVETVKAIAKERPRVVYVPRNHVEGCCYNKGMCSDNSIGCIFGQAFRRLGLVIEEAHDNDSIEDAVRLLHLPNINRQVRLCQLIQGNQDSGFCWEQAVADAEASFARELDHVDDDEHR